MTTARGPATVARASYGDGPRGGVRLVKVPSLDLYREPDPFRLPRPREIRDWVDLAEVGTMMTGGFPEPRTFSLRARRVLAGRGGGLDIVHDNQSFGTGLLGLMADGWPVIGTCHHPVTVDRLVDLAHARTWRRELSLRRWYGFVGMQNRVARRLPRLLTVSSTSAARHCRTDGRRPPNASPSSPSVPTTSSSARAGPRRSGRVPGRVMTTASADVPLKGLAYLLEALAKLRTDEPGAYLVEVGEPRPAGDAARTIERLGLEGAVTFRPGISDAELVELYRQASVVAVPSSTRAFRSLPWRRWRARSPWWRPWGAPCPRSSAPTATPPSWCRQPTPGAWPWPSGRLLSARAGGPPPNWPPASATMAGAGFWSGSPGRGAPPASSSSTGTSCPSTSRYAGRGEGETGPAGGGGGGGRGEGGRCGC